ncbi:MAG: sialate O-acetylesterase [Planctomycetota bacterium]|nr:MAG: sialate O-acetylesterase [Planctomycetota bacterium]
MKKTPLLTVGLPAVMLLASLSPAEVRLPAVIGSNMVLQQQSEAPLWGWADPGEKITIRAKWKKGRARAKADADGKWTAFLTTPKAGGPYTIRIKGANTIKLENVLVGEVWVCSGQSNMQWSVSNSNNSAEEIAGAQYPNIRLFYVKRKVADTPQDDCEGAWRECSPETIPEFSAVAYFFGRNLHKQLDIPIGLIHTSWGGTPAEAWTRRPILEANEQFAPIVRRYDKMVAAYPKTLEAYNKKLARWTEASKRAKAEGKQPPGKPRPPRGPGNPHTPGGLYNAMIAPLIPYAIKGAIWYQGESNASRAYQYRTLFPAMIKNWRDDWKQGDFPFYFVQIAPYKNQNPEIREAQLIAMKNTANTGMVVTTDIGNPDNIHPKNKQDVGKRLALWAMAKTYGRQDIVYSGPIYKGMKVEGDKIRIFFDHIGGGLVAKDGPLTHFAIAKKEGDFVPATAVIDGDTVVVSSDNVKEPADVRFGWQNTPEPNLFNKEGLPASPFRTDDRKGITHGIL